MSPQPIVGIHSLGISRRRDLIFVIISEFKIIARRPSCALRDFFQRPQITIGAFCRHKSRLRWAEQLGDAGIIGNEQTPKDVQTDIVLVERSLLNRSN